MLNVVIFVAGFDTGGQGYRIKKAFDKYQPGFSVRSIHNQETYFQYPKDIQYTARSIYDLVAEADIIHLRNGVEGLHRIRRESKKTSGLVVHYHGTKFREGHTSLAAEARSLGAQMLVSTLDLTMLEPDVEWLPSPYDFNELEFIRATNALPPDALRPIRIVHAPTARKVKSTDVLIASIQELANRGFPIQLDLIERQSHAVTLIRKSKADILVDQLALGYGNNAIEAWGLGLPVIAGVANPALREYMLEEWGEIPFYEANEKNLTARLADLIVDSELRKHWAEVGKYHARRFHNDELVVARLASIYIAALERANNG